MKKITSYFPPVVRNIEADEYFENFFIFSILSVVGIRVFLVLTGYPQLGGGGWHIAHMLWGGFFMLIALLLFFIFLNKSIHQTASVLAGIGFGTFIDELGKFITADNDYFYQPTFALIYSIFVFLYLLFRFVVTQAAYTPIEYLANALEATKEAIIHDFDVEEKNRVLEWLAQSHQHDRFTQALTQLVRAERPKVVKSSILWRLRKKTTAVYRQIVSTQWLTQIAVIFFTLQVVSYFALISGVVIFRTQLEFLLVDARFGFFGWGLIVSLLIAAILLLIGLIHLANMSRYRAYEFFRYSLLINIFLVTFFVFYFNQLIALSELILSIVLLKAFEYAQVQESKILT